MRACIFQLLAWRELRQASHPFVDQHKPVWKVTLIFWCATADLEAVLSDAL